MATPYPGESYSPFTLEMLQRHPKLLRMQEPPQEPTPYSQRGLENPPGWGDLCRRFFLELDELNRPYEDTQDSIQLAQLKSKYAELRVYIEHAPKSQELQSRLRDLISKYAQEASRTCEATGQPGRLYCSEYGWFQVMSDDQAAKYKGMTLVPAPKGLVTAHNNQDITAPVVDLQIGG